MLLSTFSQLLGPQLRIRSRRTTATTRCVVKCYVSSHAVLCVRAVSECRGSNQRWVFPGIGTKDRELCASNLALAVSNFFESGQCPGAFLLSLRLYLPFSLCRSPGRPHEYHYVPVLSVDFLLNDKLARMPIFHEHAAPATRVGFGCTKA